VAEIDLSGVDAKLSRAKRHAVELKEAVEARFDPRTYHFTFEFNADAGQYASIVHDLPEVDPEWPLILGEILFNLRSCLDHLAWQICLFDSRKPPGQNTYYPLRHLPNDRNGRFVHTQLNPAVRSAVVRDALEATQPYRTPDGTIDAQAALTHPLYALVKLNNIDKHRLVLVAAAVLDMSKMWWGLPKDFPPPKFALHPGVLQDHGPVAWFDFGPNDPPEEFDPHPAVQVSLREPEVAFLTQIPVQNFTDALCDFWVAEYILDWRFRPILNGDPPVMEPLQKLPPGTIVAAP
jgi:hypothetical protein